MGVLHDEITHAAICARTESLKWFDAGDRRQIELEAELAADYFAKKQAAKIDNQSKSISNHSRDTAP